MSLKSGLPSPRGVLQLQGSRGKAELLTLVNCRDRGEEKRLCALSLCLTEAGEQGTCSPTSLVNLDRDSARGKKPHSSGAEDTCSAKIFREAKDFICGN